MKDDNSIYGSWPKFRFEQSPRGFRNSAMIALTLASLSAGFAASPPTTRFTEVSINSATSVYFNPPPDFIRDTTGADVQLSAVGSHALAFCGTGGADLIMSSRRSTMTFWPTRL
jgi:hypothetical protein